MLRFTYRRITLCAILITFTAARLAATPMNNITDTEIFHTIQGTDKFYTKRQKGEFNLHLSPFYQHAGRARNSTGRVVPTGERLGQWNMSGLFFGTNAMPTGKTINATDYPYLYYAQNALKELANTPSPILSTFPDLTNENTFVPTSPKNPVEQYLAAYLQGVNVKHEKLGLRGKISFDFGFGLGLAVKGGLVDLKETSTFPGISRSNPITTLTGQTPPLVLNATPNPNGAPPPDFIAPSKTLQEQAAVDALYYVFTTAAQKQLFNEIGLNTYSAHETCLEDTHVQLYWQIPCAMKEKGELSVTTIPYLSIGIWLPTGKAHDQDKAFSIDTGNGGFYGLTFEGTISFDFPKLLQSSFGAGAVVSLEKDLNNYRVPSANPLNPNQPISPSNPLNPIKQSGFYPWKTSISKKPGTTWYANASFKADGFSDALSLYFDYIYTYHEKDSISLKESDAKRAASFKPGIHVLEAQSSWKSQLINVGLGYRINKNLAFGGAFQAMISGVRVFKTTTAMGSVTFSW